MEFLDNTGHIFSLPSYDEYPYGYEFEENAYTFWMDSKYTSTLSVNNYYMRTVNVMIPCYVPDDIWRRDTLQYTDEDGVIRDVCDVEITIDSQIYSLISTKSIQKQINDVGVTAMPTIDEIDFVDKLTNDDLLFIKVEQENQKFLLVPFYVIGITPEEGTWSTNVLIHVSCDVNESFVEETYCPITVGGVYQDEHEELTINGQNMGITLPEEIFRAVYQKSFDDERFDEQLYNDKLREYMMNYMGIRGSVGNFDSAIQSLKWFGYGDLIQLTKLWETDNEFKHQFLIDFFDLNNDFLESYRTFRNSTYIRLHMLLNRETGEYDDYDMNAFMWGENQPLLENLDTKMIPVTIGRNETFDYWKPYYDYTMNELGLKLACLKYYYEKYFLPIHLQIHSASLTYKVYANDIKFLNKTSVSVSEPTVNIEDDDFDVILPEDHELYLTHQIHFIDDLFNEYEAIDDDVTLYEVNDTCLNIPIRFTNRDKYYNCVLLLEKLNDNRRYIYDLNLNVALSFDDELMIYRDKTTTVDGEHMLIAFSENNVDYSLYHDGITNLREIVMSKYGVLRSTDDGTLTVTTDDDDDVLNYQVTYDGETYVLNDRQQSFEHDGSTIIIPSVDALHQSIFNEIDDAKNAQLMIYVIPRLYYRVKYDATSIRDVQVNGVSILKDVELNVRPTSTVIYESHFNFYQHDDDETSIYRDFVMYPKMLCDANVNVITNELNTMYQSRPIEYFINERFRLRLLVNNKWYTYDFTVKIPDFNIHFGTLRYKYYDDEINDNIYSQFTQLKYLGKGDDDKQVKFNSFMYEPRLVKVNHINFIKDFIKYVKLTSIKYMNGDDIPVNTFCYYFDLSQLNDELPENQQFDTQYIYIQREMLGKSFYIPVSFFTFKNLYLLVYQDTNFIISETGENVMMLSENEVILVNDDLDDGFCEDEYVKFVCDEDGKYHYVNINDHNDYRFEVYESLYQSSNVFLEKYIERNNVPMNDSHLNQIHMFDIYRRERVIGRNQLLLHNDIDLRCDNIRFIHKKYDDTLYLQGKISTENNGQVHINQSDTHRDDIFMTSYFNTRDDVTRYSIFWNDDVRYDADASNTPSGYVYYQRCDLNGMLIPDDYTTDEFTDIDYHKTDPEGNIITLGTLRYKSLKQFNTHMMKCLTDETDDVGEKYYDCVEREIKFDDMFDELSYVATSEQYDYLIEDNNTRYVEQQKMFTHGDFVYEDNKLTFTNEEDVTGNIDFTVRYMRVDPKKRMYVEYVPTINEYEYFADHIFDNETNEFRIDVTFYEVKTKRVQNIQHEYLGEVTEEQKFDSTGHIIEGEIHYYGRVNAQRVELTPYMRMIYEDQKLIGSEDVTLNDDVEGLGTRVIERQYGEHIYDVDETAFVNRENDFINQYWLRHDDEDDFIDGDVNVDSMNYVYDDEFKHLFEEDLRYNNYLVKHLTGLKGHYQIKVDPSKTKIRFYEPQTTDGVETYVTDGNEYDFDNFKIVVCIVTEDGELRGPYYQHGDEDVIFELNGNERDVSVFFMIDEFDRERVNQYFTANVEPQLCEIRDEFQMLRYEPEKLSGHDEDDMFTINFNNKTYTYEQNTSEHVWELYREFFDEDTLINTIKEKHDINFIKNGEHIQILRSKINVDNWFDYDFYLMHDESYWYGVFISKYTCDYARTIDDLLIDERSKHIYFIDTVNTECPDYLQYQNDIDDEYYYPWQMLTTEYDENIVGDEAFGIENIYNYKYMLRYNRSGKKFLVNRHYYQPSEGYNHFTRDDMIVATLGNNERLPVNIDISTKWHITPLSIDLNSDVITCESNAEMVILSAPTNSTQYERGYYNVDMRYSIDTYTTQQHKQTGKFVIE